MVANNRVNKHVAVFFGEEYKMLDCEENMTIAEIRKKWHDATSRSDSVAFLTQDNQYLSDDVTIAGALANSNARILELHAFPKSSYWLQVFGFDDTRAQFEVADILTPAAVRSEIGKALEIYTDDFRLTWDDVELDQELPFKDQGLMQGVQVMVDLRVIVKVSFDYTGETKTIDCFSSECVGDLRQKLTLSDDIAIVTASPNLQVLDDSFRVCNIASDVMDLQIPIDLTAEKKVMLAFEPIQLDHLRQNLLVALSCTPTDLYNLVSESFQLTTEHRLAVNGEKLYNSVPLRNQLRDTNDVIQIDILRSCEVFDLWEDPLDVNSYEQVYLYSTESTHELYLRDETNDQRLFHEDINLRIFGGVVDVFGAITGQQKTVLVVDRDVERSLPMLTFDGVVQRLGWARSMLIDVVPMSRGLLPKEVMSNGRLMPAKSTFNDLCMTEDTLTVTDPEKLLISSGKKLRVYRFAHGATYGDVRARMQLLKRSLDVGLNARDWQITDAAMNRKVDREILFLSSASRFQTKVTVTLKNQWYACWYEPQHVCYTDIMVSVGKQAKVMPRHLFRHSLYCCGCGRKLSIKEEPHQSIPATCCSVKSLQLTDRRVRDIGIQSASTRRRDVETQVLNAETGDAHVREAESVTRTAVSVTPKLEETDLTPQSGSTMAAGIAPDLEDSHERTVKSVTRTAVSVTPKLESASTTHPLPLRIWVMNPADKGEKKIVRVQGGSGGALLAMAGREFPGVFLGSSPVVFALECVYGRNDEERRALKCYDEKAKNYPYIDLQDGEIVDESSLLRYCRRFFSSSSSLPSSPNLPPAIFIQTKADILTIGPDRQLQAAPKTTLTDPSVVAFLRGVRSRAQLFWELEDSCFADAESGQIFKLGKIPGSPKSFVYALLRDKDQVPRIEVPENKALMVFRRDNLELRVERGSLRCAEHAQPASVERWSFSKNLDIFDIDFASSSRR